VNPGQHSEHDPRQQQPLLANDSQCLQWARPKAKQQEAKKPEAPGFKN
jgi:hypothetical protein